MPSQRDYVVGPIPAALLRQFCVRLLVACGSKPTHAVIVADCLLDAELDGYSSHGLSRLPLYLRRLSQGLINSSPRLRVAVDAGPAIVLDGDNAFGAVAAHRAMQLAIARATAYSVGLCAVKNSNHLGGLSFYVRKAARRGCIGLACTNSAAAIAPPGSRRAALGTNPIAAGIPTGGEPLIIDMSTSQVNRSWIIEAAANGNPLEPGWALDEFGEPTQDPEAAARGSLVPIGGAKGFGLALIVEVLSALISGASISPNVTGTFSDSSQASGIGHLMLCINPFKLNPRFASQFADLLSTLRAGPPVSKGTDIRLPGDRRERVRAENRITGIFVKLAVAETLERVAADHQLVAPWTAA